MASKKERHAVALVTGATGAIGKAIAEGIAERPGFDVVLVCRDAGKAEAAVADIKHRTGNQRIGFEIADLGRKASVEALAKRLQAPVRVLVNNAAITPKRREETPEGIERQLATNVLGYFWMMIAFRDHLSRSAPARVVNVASYWAGGLDLQDLEFKRRRYDNDSAYRQSKQAERMLTAAFAERFHGAGISVNACHPGDVLSNLSRSLGFGGHESPEQGASTPVWLATDPAGAETTGSYFEHQKQVSCRFAADRASVEALFDTCATRY